MGERKKGGAVALRESSHCDFEVLLTQPLEPSPSDHQTDCADPTQ